MAPLDRLLGGGFPIGRLSEICGQTSAAPSTGRTAVAQGLLAETLSRGVLAAWVDLADAFDPGSALAAIEARGGEAADLDQLLWIRARDEDEALRCCERVMRTEGFELVVFDLFRPQDGRTGGPQDGRTGGPQDGRPDGPQDGRPDGPQDGRPDGPQAADRDRRSGRPRGPSRRPRPPRLRVKDVTWLRLARLAAGTRTTLVALSDAPSTGSRAELVLEMRPGRVLFRPPPHLLESLETEAVLRRHRSRPTGEKVALTAALDSDAAPLPGPVQARQEDSPRPSTPERR